MTLIVLGYGGVLFPEFRLRTPMSIIMPSGFMQNPLVRDYMLPPHRGSASLGAPEAYIRPSAPFPYANSWDLAYTLLTPVMRLLRLRSIWLRIALLIGMALFYCACGLRPVTAVCSFWSRYQRSVPVTGCVSSWRLIGVRWWRALRQSQLWLWRSLRRAPWTIFWGRQDYSDSTGVRRPPPRYMEGDFGVPIIGYGTPRMEPSIGVSMGTQGYVDSDVLLRFSGPGSVRALHGVHCGNEAARG